MRLSSVWRQVVLAGAGVSVGLLCLRLGLQCDITYLQASRTPVGPWAGM